MGLQLRLNKFLAERLGVSRREADDLILANKITIDGKPAVLGARIDESNKICYNNKTIPFQTEYSYLAFYKPVDYVCSRRAQGKAPTLYELLPKKYRKLKTVGRLDKDSSGLILLTNDGDFAFQMTHPKFRKTKVYEVELDKLLEPLHQQMISDHGVMLDDGPSQFKVLKDTSAKKASFEGGPEPGKARSSATTPVADHCRSRADGKLAFRVEATHSGRPEGSTGENDATRNGNIFAKLAKSEEILDYIKNNQTVILDPPRSGCDYKLIDKLNEITPAKIIYLSCNPATQARDIKLLLDNYQIEDIKAFNFFPHTPHIENLVILSRK